MKKLLIITVLVFGLAACDGAPSSVSLVDPDHAYEIDTWFENSEVYEFTPKSNSNYTCVMLMLDSGAAMGLQCFPKPVS